MAMVAVMEVVMEAARVVGWVEVATVAAMAAAVMAEATAVS